MPTTLGIWLDAPHSPHARQARVERLTSQRSPRVQGAVDRPEDGAVIEVRPGGRRRIDRVLAPEYIDGIGNNELGEVRELRDEAAQEETDLSYLRRMLHARIDIVRAEQHRRTDGSAPVMDRLASILSDNAVGPATGSGRYQTIEPSRAEAHRKIGRASCRERVEAAVVGEAVTEKMYEGA